MKTPSIYTPTEIQNWPNGESYEGDYRSARCIVFDLSVLHQRRWRIAWRIFTGRYDALDWENTESGSPTVEEAERLYKK